MGGAKKINTKQRMLVVKILLLLFIFLGSTWVNIARKVPAKEDIVPGWRLSQKQASFWETFKLSPKNHRSLSYCFKAYSASFFITIDTLFRNHELLTNPSKRHETNNALMETYHNVMPPNVKIKDGTIMQTVDLFDLSVLYLSSLPTKIAASVLPRLLDMLQLHSNNHHKSFFANKDSQHAEHYYHRTLVIIPLIHSLDHSLGYQLVFGVIMHISGIFSSPCVSSSH